MTNQNLKCAGGATMENTNYLPTRCNVTNEVPGLGEGLRKMGDASWDDYGFYAIRLNLFPRARYFLKSHPVRMYEYVLYSYCESGFLSRPVGRGELIRGTHYVKVQFFDVAVTFYMQNLQLSKMERTSA